MRERLIEMIQNSVGGCARHWAEIITDARIANVLIVTPCKVGDTVYSFWRYRDRSGIVEHKVNALVAMESEDDSFRFSDFGKTVFLTREEAEKALKEAQG